MNVSFFLYISYTIFQVWYAFYPTEHISGAAPWLHVGSVLDN